MSAAKMVADSTQGDFDEPRKKRKKKKENTKKRSKKMKKKDSRKDKGSRKEEEDSDLDLEKDLYPISDYIRERQDLNEQLFHCLRGPSLQRYIPDVLKSQDDNNRKHMDSSIKPSLHKGKELPLEELKKRCLEHLEIMSKKRIKRILSGDDPASISSSGTDDESSDEEPEVPPQDPEEDETEETNIEETEEPEDGREIQEAEQMSVDSDLEEGETFSDRERERSDEEDVSIESEGEITSDESDGEIKDENDNSDDDPEEIDKDDDTDDGEGAEKDNTEIDKNSETKEDINQDENKQKKLDSEDGCKLESMKTKIQQDRSDSPSSSTDGQSVPENEKKEAGEDNSSTEGNTHDIEIDEGKDDNSSIDSNQRKSDKNEIKGDNSPIEGNTHIGENEDKGDNSTKDDDASKHVVDSTSSIEENLRDSNDSVKSDKSCVSKDNDSNIEENSSPKYRDSFKNINTGDSANQTSADTPKFPTETEMSSVDIRENTTAENNPTINHEESDIKNITEEKNVFRDEDSMDYVEKQTELEHSKILPESELELPKKTIVLSQDMPISQINDISNKNSRESVENIQEDENLSRLKQEAVNSMKKDERKIEIGEKAASLMDAKVSENSLSPVDAKGDTTQTDTRSVIIVNKTEVSSSSLKIPDTAGTSVKVLKDSTSKLVHISPPKTSEQTLGTRKVIVKDSPSKLMSRSTEIKKLSQHASEKRHGKTITKTSAGTSSSSKIIQKSTTPSVKSSKADTSGNGISSAKIVKKILSSKTTPTISGTSSSKIVEKASSSKNAPPTKVVSGNTPTEVSTDETLAPALTKNQMELLELEMRARAIKAMLVAHEKKDRKVLPTGSKKGK